ncbi:HEAT repeat domain-containing protein [Spirulina sp. CCNP1310]|uniref:HEAT repeat domain-containing protein n=1 Tax=Spirulina sp. CCNP1310 TaxID=3110249 RepID=UPI002B2019AC|nr:HEAT repeat domain-containing protein [Spirulina sp. CCNP1310]MEA5419026.1 HEAT repeat domain-containing protein [Spirulina sp. CCNP1310]
MKNSSSTADALIAALREPGREHLVDLVRNPLRLTLLCMTWDGLSLPETQAELYDRYLRKMYGWNRNLQVLRDHARCCGMTITQLKRELNRELGELAKAAFNLPQERFRLSQVLVEEYLGEELDESSLACLALRLGWLNRVGRDGRGDFIFAFYHGTFQEYFAALAVEDWGYFLPKDHVDRPVVGKAYRIFEKQWKQVILFWLGRGDIGEEKKEGFIGALVEFKDGVRDFYGYQAYFLAAAGINQFKACSLASKIVQQILKCSFGDFNPEKQEWLIFLDPIKEVAKKAIHETIRPLVIIELIAIFQNCPDKYFRRRVIHNLGEIGQGNPEAITALVNLITTTEDESTRFQATESLKKIDPGNSEAIAALANFIGTAKNEYTRRRVIRDLEEIGQGNPDAIAVLVNFIATTENKDTLGWAAYSLGIIDPGNVEAIAVFISLIATTENKSTRRSVAIALLEIDPGNPEVIAALVNLIATTEDESTRRWVAESLGEIDPGNPDAITALLNLIATTEDELTRWQAAYSLEKIGQGNPDAIAGLLEIIRTAEYKYIRGQAVKSLGKIGQGNLDAIAGLLEIIRTSEDKSTRRQSAYSLEKIGQGNPDAIAGLLQVIRTSEDKSTRRWAAESLGEIDPGNPDAIAELLQVIRTSEDKSTRRQAAESLGKIDPGNPDAIAGLLQIIQTTEDESIRRWVAESLGKIDPGNLDAITVLLNLIATTEKEDTWINTTRKLEEILTTRQQYAGVVTALKHNLSDEVYQNKFRRFEASYEVLWNCAENLPYPDFYQAWHNPPTTPHPEIENNTPTGPTPFTQHQNLTLLPQILNQTNPTNHQIICIDTNRFSDPTNPALQIYTTLKKADCPPIPDKPRTIPELQAYCEDELSNHQIALILHQQPTNPPPQNLDLGILNQLTRFSHPPIALILPQPLPNCPLPQFLENDPNLIPTIIQWLQNLER